MKRKNICCPLSEGGLGLKDIYIFNNVLLAKWRWSIFHENGSLWRDTLESKYEG